MLLVGEAVHVWGQRVDGKSLCFPFNIVLNLKVSKNKVFLNIAHKRTGEVEYVSNE